MCDKLVYDLAQEIEGTPSVFVRKDWINILDNQNQNYSSNQSVIDTSQLSNSNKYMGYREGYLLVPLTLTLAQKSAPVAGSVFDPTGATSKADSSIGLKNWFGQIVHSMTLDYNGTTIIQQTPFINMWNSFKLMTSLSYGDIITQGATIGFYPDDPTSFTFSQVVDGNVTDDRFASGTGVCNNAVNAITGSIVRDVSSLYTQYSAGCGNKGLLMRQRYSHYDPQPPINVGGVGNWTQSGSTADYSKLLSAVACEQLWKSYVFKKVQGTDATRGLLQIGVVATIYLKHLHSFFNMIPLIKGAFMKLTLNLNNTSSTVVAGRYSSDGSYSKGLKVTSVSNSLGGVNPGMVCAGGRTEVLSQVKVLTDTSPEADPPALGSVRGVVGAGALNNGRIIADTIINSSLTYSNSGDSLFAGITAVANSTEIEYVYNISVGKTCLDQSITSLYAGAGGLGTNPLAQSIYLYVPAYTFNPVFEQAYLSSPVKEIKYTDIYQYQVLGVAGSKGSGGGSPFNNLITNGIANIKSILILPYYSANTGTVVAQQIRTRAFASVSDTTGLPQGMPVYQSPFDPAGAGPTSPLALITNFNVQVSGQNAIYNTQKYAFEQFNHQLYGQNAVNGGLTDGITSGLIDRLGFDMEYCYYYVDLSRMLPVEQSVPKSVQILGNIACSKPIDLFCFIEYQTQVSLDILSGSRV